MKIQKVKFRSPALKWRRSCLILALLLSSAIILACGGNVPASSKKGDKITVHILSSQGGEYGLNALGKLNATEGIPLFYLFEGLVRLNLETGYPEPSLAKEWVAEDLVLPFREGRALTVEEAFDQGLFGEVEERDGKLLITPHSPRGGPEGHQGKDTRQFNELKRDSVAGILPNTVYTFFLRKGVVWHTGKPFRAEDVLFTFETLMNPSAGCVKKQRYFKDLVACRVVDSHTVRLVYCSSTFNHIDNLASLPIISREVFEDSSLPPKDQGEAFLKSREHERPVGTGPYSFQGWGRDFLTLQRNEAYWGKRPEMKTLRFQLITDTSTAFHVMQSEESLDFCFRLSRKHYEAALGNSSFQLGYRLHKYWTPNYDYIGWNLRRDPFRDKRVRLALAHLFDRKEFIENILGGGGRVVNGHQSSSCRMYDGAVKGPAYDPGEARRLLSEAGWLDRDGDSVLDREGKRFSFSILVPSKSTICQQASRVFQERLKKAGIEMRVVSLNFRTMMNRIDQNDFDSFFLKWTLDPEPDLKGSWASGTGRQYKTVGFSNTSVDRVINELRESFEPEERKKLWRQFQDILVKEQPYLFLWELPRYAAVSKRFANVRFYPVYPGWNLCEWKLR